MVRMNSLEARFKEVKARNNEAYVQLVEEYKALLLGYFSDFAD